MSCQRRSKLYWFALSVELLLFVVWQCSHLEGFQWTTDEGLYAMRVRLMQQGDALYRDIWTDQLPGFVQIVRLAFALGGSRIEAARVAVALLSAGGLLGTAIVAQRLAGRVAALTVVPLVAVVPNYYWLSRAAISPTLPSISVAVVSLALISVYTEQRRLGWLVASALTMAIALYIKTTAVLLVPACVIWLWQARHAPADWRRDALRWGLMASAPLVLALAVQHPAAMWNQFALTQLESAGMDLKIGPHAQKIGVYLLENWGLSALALAGLIVCALQRREALPVMGGWLLTTYIVLLLRSPMWPGHHLSVLLYPLGILAACAVAALVTALRARRAEAASWLAAAGVAAQLGALPGIVQANSELASAPTYDSALHAVEFLQERYPEGTEVISDYHMIPFRAGCSVPPSLATITKKRLQLGLLDADTLAAAAREEGVTTILLWDEQLASSEAFVNWARQDYALALKWGYHEILCMPQPDEVTFDVDLGFGSALKLERYGVRRLAADPGGELEVVLYWRVLMPIDDLLHGFVHVVDDSGRGSAQHDQLAFGIEHDSRFWRVGELIEDRYLISVPKDTPSGQYWFSVGLYEDDSNSRLPIRETETGKELGGQVVLKPRPVVRWSPEWVAPPSDHVGSWRFGELGELVGWSAQQRDGTIEVELVWRAERGSPATSHTVFVHLRRDDELATQDDSPPASGARPTTGWQEGEYLIDSHALAVDALSPGRYDVYVGLYDPDSVVRLPVTDADGVLLPNAEAHLGQVVVGP